MRQVRVLPTREPLIALLPVFTGDLFPQPRLFAAVVAQSIVIRTACFIAIVKKLRTRLAFYDYQRRVWDPQKMVAARS